MKARFLALSLALALLISLFSVSVSAADEITYPVEGGDLYFDPATGTVTKCDFAVTAAEIPYEIGGVPVTAIGNLAFENCEALASVSIPDTVTSIGRHAFAYCHSLTEITLPDSVYKIEDQAFFDCTALKKVDLGRGVLLIGRDILWGTAYLRNRDNWKDGLLYAGDILIKADTALTGVVKLPENTRVVAGSAFYACTSLTAVILPQGLQAIGTEGFYYCIDLEQLELPDSLSYIGEAAFRYCASLREVKSGSGLEQIGKSAFEYCGKLSKVTLGRQLKDIGSYAFAECDELTEIRFLGDAPKLGEYPFDTYSYSAKEYAPTPGLSLCYVSCTSGWESPQWKGYPTKTWHPSDSFTDVPPSSWFCGSVDYALCKGLMNGVSATQFAPEEPMTRAMLVTVLWRYAGAPIEGTNHFSDVPEGTWYTEAVAWASHNGVVNGVGNGCFEPDGAITREQMAVILHRYCGSIGIDTAARAELSTFPDAAKISSYAAEALSWAVKTGLITGSAQGGEVYLEPQGDATRAQVATVLMRLIENILQ